MLFDKHFKFPFKIFHIFRLSFKNVSNLFTYGFIYHVVESFFFFLLIKAGKCLGSPQIKIIDITIPSDSTIITLSLTLTPID